MVVVLVTSMLRMVIKCVYDDYGRMSGSYDDIGCSDAFVHTCQ